jgi:hypothetical protein
MGGRMEVLSVTSSTAVSTSAPPRVRDATIIIVGENCSSELRVNKDLMCAKSTILKDLFESATGPIKLEERDSAQLALFLELIHSPHLQNSVLLLTIWNSSHPKLACKYLLDDFVDRYAALAKIELKRLCPSKNLVVENDISYHGFGKSPLQFGELMGVFTKSSEVLYINNSDNGVTMSKYGSRWEIRQKGNQTFLYSDSQNSQEPKSGSWSVSIDGYGQNSLHLTVKNCATGVRCAPFGPDTPDSALFWDVVNAVMTHDGIRFHLRSTLGDKNDLRALLTSTGEYPFQFWHVCEMLKHFTIEEFASMCLEAGGVLKP